MALHQWNVERIFEDAGGVEGVFRSLDGKVKRGTIRMWRSRGSIPADHLASLITAHCNDVYDWLKLQHGEPSRETPEVDPFS